MSGRRNRRMVSSGLHELGPIVSKMENGGIMLLLFETPSGFALFTFSEVYLYLPGSRENIWAQFGNIHDGRCQVFLQDFQTFEDKSSAINLDTGVNEELANMINKQRLRRKMKLGVGKHEYKTIIESNLEIPCVFNEVIMEVMWGIQNLIHEFLPEEKSEVNKEDRLPMSQGLQQLLRRYEFDLEPDMVNQQIVQVACALHFCDAVYEKHLSCYSHIPLELKDISDINCGDWDALKLATALKVLAYPKEEIDFPEVFAQDELSKMKADAPKYIGIIPPAATCFGINQDIISAHHRRIEKKKLLRSLVKQAKKEPEAEPAEVYEGERQGESEQIPQSRDSASEPVMIFSCETMCRRRVSRLSPPEDLPYSESQSGRFWNMDSDHNTNVGKFVLTGVEAVDRGLYALAEKYKAALSKRSEDGMVTRRRARLNQKNVAYQHVKLEDRPCKHPKKSAAHSPSSPNVTG